MKAEFHNHDINSNDSADLPIISGIEIYAGHQYHSERKSHVFGSLLKKILLKLTDMER